MPDASSADAPLVVVDHVSKTYRMGAAPVHALRDVSLTLPRGSFTGVVGPSGSGKSTLLHLLAALDAPTQGTLRVGEWTLGALSAREQSRFRRTMVGVVFQQFHLIPTMTALQNVALPLILAGVPPAERARRAAACLAQVDLADRTGHRPVELSGGEQQRVAVARALVGDPPLLLADEPTGNLDADTGAQIIDLLADLHRTQGRTVVVVTHHPASITAYAQRLIRLRDGARAST
ncbi:ABC transporter ATP-binding protein [Salisaeta longa]|uniref:ABC transporter ATP-binding protein n=1 Tax=Salisaeta longa TaxID=503170 RepID=UPI0003B3E14B|nr:ABC transporter ATP-binding protein [Salisaeta longa]